MTPFSWNNPYAWPRKPLLAQNVVATSQPLAAQAGLQMLAAGGSAVDAILATAITLSLVEPVSNGIGSDAYALVWDRRKLRRHRGALAHRVDARLFPRQIGNAGARMGYGDRAGRRRPGSSCTAIRQAAVLLFDGVRYGREGFWSPTIAGQWESASRQARGLRLRAFLPEDARRAGKFVFKTCVGAGKIAATKR
jgi:gamma-glutamyltranspeptidase/glutathione hydrolase